ncbi:MAG: group 1 glycosyl transferase [Methylotenera sp. 24-45-7]|nr:MAG: group 1 glycosyl transferase [Mehylophilales bacterium 35-46-6]OYZ39703.1 MAG: group 1 glycosyl transferase [Methylotenera sp. 24-45-7]OZA09771.1 MAG: group 1 glycosyl transferase [Methylotenera sp. 17-45-7]OZA53902.1 MAG: group 1 glycosyl transferase [Methylophilales bacterium 39-45-7]HQS37408.1 glycosyltransferase family 4 protein [Methylotenera sp.]
MKFAFLIFKVFPYGGVQRDMLRIAHDCVAAGHEVIIYTGEWRGDMPDPRIQVEILPSRGWLNHQRHQSLINAMQQALAKSPVDLVMGFNRMSGLDGYYAADPCFLERAHEEKSWLYRLTGRYRFFAAAEQAVMGEHSQCQILLLTEREKYSFQQWYNTPDARFHLLPPSIPLEKFADKNREYCRAYLREQFGLPPDANVVLTVGSAFVRKGVDRAIDAIAALPEDLKLNTWLLAIGEYESNSNMQAYCEKRGVSHHCIQAGGRADIADLMLGADILAHPARSELAGIVLIEAMTAGLPVLVTDVCGYATHVAEANAGLVLPSPYQQQDMNQALVMMLQDAKQVTWRASGQAYVRHIKNTSSAKAEADFIIAFSEQKVTKHD